MESRLKQTDSETVVRNSAEAPNEHLSVGQGPTSDGQDRVVAVKVEKEPLIGEENEAQKPSVEESGNHVPPSKLKENTEPQIPIERSQLPSPSHDSGLKSQRRGWSPSLPSGQHSHTLKQHSRSPKRHSRSPHAKPVSYTHLTLPTKRIV